MCGEIPARVKGRQSTYKVSNVDWGIWETERKLENIIGRTIVEER